MVRVVGECMCLTRGGLEVLWVTQLGLGFTNSRGTWGKWDMCLCFGCGGVGEGGVVLCLCVL